MMVKTSSDSTHPSIKQKHKTEIKLSTLKNASQIYKSLRGVENNKKGSTTNNKHWGMGE